jgi:hypothetical protein
MAPALVTLTALSILGISAAFVVGMRADPASTSLHVLFGVFSTMLNLLAHSLMMFYLIGKGKAVREAVAESALDSSYVQRISRLRAPVFSRAPLAMALTMAAAIAAQLYAFFTELVALTGSARVVDEVNARIR